MIVYISILLLSNFAALFAPREKDTNDKEGQKGWQEEREQEGIIAPARCQLWNCSYTVLRTVGLLCALH